MMDARPFDMTFDLPTSWRHGRGVASDVGQILKKLGCRKPLLLTDRVLLSLGVVRPVTESLEKEGISYTICDDVDREPTVALFDAIIEKLDLSSMDAIVAVGGGSVLDVAKGIAVIASFGGHIRDYAGGDKVPGVPRQKIIAVPTTSGTGSEVSDGVVLIDEERGTKFLVISKKICPTVALTDPKMTTSMPPMVTVCSGVDALVHATESYVSNRASIITELFALKAIGFLSAGMKPALRDGSDLTAREKMQLGATMAMIAGMNSYLGLCHALAMPLCGLYHMPHGQACGMVLPHVLKYNEKVTAGKIKNVFVAMGFSDPGESGDAPDPGAYARLQGFLEEIGVKGRLGRMGYQDAHMDTIVEATLNSWQRMTNPRNPTEEDIAEIVQAII